MSAEFDLSAVAKRLLDLGLMDKPFRDLSRDEALEMCQAIHAATKRRSLQLAPGAQGQGQAGGV